MSATAARVFACRDCGTVFVPAQPWWRLCSSCFRPRPRLVAEPTRQLSLADTVEWAEATSPNVVALSCRRR